ncbi:MAG: hypothetical protein J6T10_06920 [Methanobrevibacter sp.]|nr:hypothetical protein [Methanobrevibacter sp.]
MKLLLYCTKTKPYLVKEAFKGYMATNNLGILEEEKERFIFNGKIVAECDFKVEEICSEKLNNGVGYEPIFYTETIDNISSKSCLTQFEIENYLGCKVNGEKVGYAIHIKNLNIFDKPRELFNYCGKSKQNVFYHIENAPQNMMYCYGKNTGEKYVLISIRPE